MSFYLIEPYNPWSKVPRKKHWMEIAEEEAMMARIVAEQMQQQNDVTAMGAVGAGGVPPYSYFHSTTSGPTIVSFPVNLFISFESGTSGSFVTASSLNSSTVGTGSLGAWTIFGNSGNNAGIVTHTRFSGDNFSRRTPFLINDTYYYGTGSKGVIFNFDEDLVNYDEMVWTPTSSIQGTFSITAMVKFNPNLVAQSHYMDHIRLGGFTVLQQRVNDDGVTTSLLVGHHQGEGQTFNSYQIYITPGTLYSITMRMNVEDARIELVVLDGVTGELVGCAFTDCPATDVVYVMIQDYLSHAMGGNVKWDNIAMAWGANAVIPLEEFTIPDPVNVTLVQEIGGQLKLTWNDRKAFFYKIERQANGGAWETLETSYEATTGVSTYTDSTVSNGVSYKYRVTAIIDVHVSSPVESNSVTVDNSSSPVVVDNFTGGSFGSNLSDRTGWSASTGSCIIWSSGRIYTSGFNGIDYYDGITPTANQKSEVEIVSFDDGRAGPTVRVQTGSLTGYGFLVDASGYVELTRYNSGVVTTITSTVGQTIASGSRLSLEATGTGSATRLTAKIYNGGVWTTIFNNYDPSVYIDGGYFGIGSRGGGGVNLIMDNWKGYNI